jgi:hypothetical protein
MAKASSQKTGDILFIIPQRHRALSTGVEKFTGDSAAVTGILTAEVSDMTKKKTPRGATPDVHSRHTGPRVEREVAQRYGVDSTHLPDPEEQLFPMMGPGMPGDWQRMVPERGTDPRWDDLPSRE